MKRLNYLIIIILSIFSSSVLQAQNYYPIYNLSSADLHTIPKVKRPHTLTEAHWVRTSGVITFIMPDTQYPTFFLQDAYGDGLIETSDAIYVQLIESTPILPNNELHIVGILKHDGYRFYIDSAIVEQQSAASLSIEATPVIFPDDFGSWSALEGMALTFNQTLHVVSNYFWARYGQLTLSSKRLHIPTEVVLPGSSAYHAMVTSNRIDQITLDDGSSVSYPNPLPFADIDGTRRTGSRINNLTAILTNTSNGYMLYPIATPIFYGNSRPKTPTLSANYNIKVCGFNLEYYLASNYGSGYGPENSTEAARQHQKIVHAMMAIDADVYGLVEIQTGQGAIQKLCDAMNAAAQTTRYAYINDGSSTNGTYTKSGYIYRSDKLAPIKSIKNNNTVVSNRKKAQGFQLLANGEGFVFCMNHFKSKSGYGNGANADQGDGQGSFNADRITEANSVINNIPSYISYFGDDDILIMGDLNAYSQEDPLMAFYNAEYINLLTYFRSDSAYSYVYKNEIGCLDHALANRSMAQQVVDVTVFHINADEPTLFSYASSSWQNNMYRSSDHDPVIVYLNLGTYADSLFPNINKDLYVVQPLTTPDIFTIFNAAAHWMTIADMQGRILHHIYIKESEVSFSVSELGLSPGVYLLAMDDRRSKKPNTLKLLIK